MSGTAVGYWEAGATEIGIFTLVQLAEVLGVTPGWLAFGQEPRYPRYAAPEGGFIGATMVSEAAPDAARKRTLVRGKTPAEKEAEAKRNRRRG